MSLGIIILKDLGNELDKVLVFVESEAIYLIHILRCILRQLLKDAIKEAYNFTCF